MSDYIHGAYSNITTVGTVKSNLSSAAIVYVGTAPVHTIEGHGESTLNQPVVVESFAQARKIFGYSDDWEYYTLCEAMKVHFQDKGVGPLILINVLDTEKHYNSQAVSKTATPVNGKIVLEQGDAYILDSLKVTGKVKGTDFNVSYNWKNRTVTISEVSAGKLGTEQVTITGSKIDPQKVTDSDVIGSSANGIHTGLYAVKSVYQKTGYIPSYLCVPGFSSTPAIHNVMAEVSKKVNGHWDMYMFVDLKISTTMYQNTSAMVWKEENGYNRDNETVYYPMIKGVDGNNYHLSVLAAANLQEMLLKQDGIPYKTVSNTEIAIASHTFHGVNIVPPLVFDVTEVNEKYNKHGIASAAFVGGRWAIWGAHSADYNQNSEDSMNISETSRMMLYYIGNDFQRRRFLDIDKPLSRNMINSIVSEEQARLDALVKIGALVYGEVSESTEEQDNSDIVNGDLKFVFNLTTSPLAKSMTAVVQWTDAGLSLLYE